MNDVVKLHNFFHTHGFSGLIPVKLRKAGANLKTSKAFAEGDTTNYHSFLNLLFSFAYLEPRDGAELWKPDTYQSACSALQLHNFFVYFTCQVLLDLSLVFEVTKQKLFLKIKNAGASLSVATHA